MKVHTPSDGPRYHFSTDIPEFYEDTLLRVVPCNPHQRYVYWEIPADIRSSCSSLLLKVSLVNDTKETASTSPDTISEYLLDSQNTHHYITLNYPSLEYRYELLAVYNDSSRKVICSTQPTPPQQLNAAPVSQEIISRSTGIDTQDTTVSSKVHQENSANQPATMRKVPILPSSWAAGNSYSS